MELSIGDLKELMALTARLERLAYIGNDAAGTAIQVGQKYLIRTPTVYHLGEVVRVTSTEVVLNTCSWIADTGRFNECLKLGTYKECEPMGDGVIVPRCNISDMSPWNHALPTVPK